MVVVPNDSRGGPVWLYATARRVMANQRRSSRRRSALHERLALDAASGTQAQPAENFSSEMQAKSRLGWPRAAPATSTCSVQPAPQRRTR